MSRIRKVRVRALRRIDHFKEKIKEAEDKRDGHHCNKHKKEKKNIKCRNRQNKRIRHWEEKIEELKKKVPKQERRKEKTAKFFDKLKEDQDKKIMVKRKTLKFIDKHKQKIQGFAGVLSAIAPFVAPFNPALAGALVGASELLLVGVKLLNGVNKGVELADAIANVVEAIAHKEKGKEVLNKTIIALEKAIDVAETGEKSKLVEKLKIAKDTFRLMEKSIEDLKGFLKELKKGNVEGVVVEGIKLGKDVKEGVGIGKDVAKQFK